MILGTIQGDTRSLDYGSCRVVKKIARIQGSFQGVYSGCVCVCVEIKKRIRIKKINIHIRGGREDGT